MERSEEAVEVALEIRRERERIETELGLACQPFNERLLALRKRCPHYSFGVQILGLRCIACGMEMQPGDIFRPDADRWARKLFNEKMRAEAE